MGNKVDLRGKLPCIPPEVGEQYAKKLEDTTGLPVRYIEASALHNMNVEEAFRNLARTIILNYLRKKREASK